MRTVMARTRILLADDHDIVRKGLRYLLGKHHDLEIVGEALMPNPFKDWARMYGATSNTWIAGPPVVFFGQIGDIPTGFTRRPTPPRSAPR